MKPSQTGGKRWRGSTPGEAPAPDPLAKPEYAVVWSAKQNAVDVNSDTFDQILANPTDLSTLTDLLGPEYRLGLDGYQVIDMRPHDIDGSPNLDFGRVVNFAQIPPPWGIGTEAHHMSYEWNDGDPLPSAGLINGATFVLNVDDVPNLELTNTITMLEAGGSIPDAFERLDDGRYLSSYIGGPLANFGGAPGTIAVLEPDPEKGLVLESSTPAGRLGAVLLGNAGGVPEACSLAEARPLGSCANPHGIQARGDLDRAITFDVFEGREMALDPLQPLDRHAFRPTVRTWDISETSHPKLIATANMPDGWRPESPNAAPGEGGKTWPNGTVPNMLPSKGVFAGSGCGGGVLFNPDISRDKGNASKNWTQVWDDTISQAFRGDAGWRGSIGPAGKSGRLPGRYLAPGVEEQPVALPRRAGQPHRR